MLLDFTLENWMSFRDPVTFTMMPDEENLYNYELPKLKDDSKVLPVAVIFGGNASGKSNFVKSLNFARDFIVRGSYPDEFIPVNTFKLEMDYKSNPVKLSFILAVKDKVYSYEFATTHEYVVNESMHEMEGEDEIPLYIIENGKITVSDRLQFSTDIKYAFKRKRRDQLLLTTVSHLTDIQLPVYSWFLDMVIVQPHNNHFLDALNNDHRSRRHVNEILTRLDCGVDSIGVAGRKLRKIGSKGGSGNGLFDKSGEAVRPRLITFHKNAADDLIQFELEEESDGTIRLFELIPVFIELSGNGSNCVFVIDEIERSLHTQLVCTLVNAYLTNCNPQTRTQLIFTTHDVQLMDETELLNDEIWLAERNEFGISDLFSLGDFKDIDLEKSIRNSYLVGRFGGKPSLSLLANQLKRKPSRNRFGNTNVKKK